MSILPMPRIPAKKAMRLVNRDHLAALGTGPSLFFMPDEIPYAELPDILEVVDHAHAVLGSIPLIQMLQPVAGEAVAAEAVLESGIRHFVTVPNAARDDGFRFNTAVAPAAGA
jgi:hypothetical protein